MDMNYDRAVTVMLTCNQLAGESEFSRLMLSISVPG